jgi:hypothetical protein
MWVPSIGHKVGDLKGLGRTAIKRSETGLTEMTLSGSEESFGKLDETKRIGTTKGPGMARRSDTGGTDTTLNDEDDVIMRVRSLRRVHTIRRSDTMQTEATLNNDEDELARAEWKLIMENKGSMARTESPERTDMLSSNVESVVRNRESGVQRSETMSSEDTLLDSEGSEEDARTKQPIDDDPNGGEEPDMSDERL